MAPAPRWRQRREPGHGSAPAAGEVYLEYFSIGNQTRVVAIDAASGVEVTVFGPNSVGRDEIARIAVRKLERRLAGPGKD